MSMRLVFLLVLAMGCLIPSEALADGISPILNLFHKDTWQPAALVTVVIILVESGLLRWRVKQVSYLGTFWRSAVLNLASSIAGSVLLVGLGRDSFFVWDTMALVLPLFIITLITEIPLLRLLYKGVPLGWRRASALGVGINAASYVAVFVVEIAVILGALSIAGRVDEKEQSSWVHPELLAQSTGQIYATETSAGGSHRLRVLDTRTAQWLSLTNCPSLDPNKWDVEGSACGFVRWTSQGPERQTVLIASLPDFSNVREISLSGLADTQYDREYNWQDVSDLSLSPDAKKVAVLFHVTSAVAYRDNSSYFDLGGKCVLAVYDLNSGQQLIRASRWASDAGLCWFPDSSAVLFSSFKDESVYKTAKSEVRGDTSYSIGYAKGEKFRRGLFALKVTTGEIQWFAEGEQPAVSVGSRKFIVRAGDEVHVLDMDGESQTVGGVSRLGYS